MRPSSVDERVGVEVGAGAAGAVGVLRGAVQRRRVRDREEDAAVAVDGRRVPEAATAVDLRVPEERVAALDGVEAPLRLAAGRVQRVDDALRAAAVEVGDPVTGHGAEQDGVVIELRRHVDALAALVHQVAGPDQLPVCRVKRERVGLRRAVEPSPAVGDPVRAEAGLVERMLPFRLAGRAIEGIDVGVEVLQVDGVAKHDRGRGKGAEAARALEGERPLDLQLRDVGSVDRTRRRRARVGEVVVERRPCTGVGGPLGGRRAERCLTAAARRLCDRRRHRSPRRSRRRRRQRRRARRR